MKYQLWLVCDEGEEPKGVICSNVPWNDYADPISSIEQISLPQLTQMLDDALQDGNYHQFAGMAGKMARIITQYAGEDAAKSILWEVAIRGGFDELGG